MTAVMVSVVIPTYNRAADLKRALASLQAQSFTDWEALVVDNHSVDDTDQVVADCNDSRVRLLKIRNDGVIAASRNLGIRNAHGTYIAFLDSDDWWLPTKLAISVRALEDGADLIYHPLYLATNTGISRKRTYGRALRPPVFDDLLANGNAISNSSVVLRKELLDEIGGLSEAKDLIAIEDYDAWMKIARITDRFREIPRPLGYYWVGGGNVSNPARTIQTLEAIEHRYADAFRSLRAEQRFCWLDYARAKTYARMGLDALARQHLKRLELRSAPAAFRLRWAWTFACLGFRSIAKSHR